MSEERDELCEWLDSLTPAQVQALASQAGIENWHCSTQASLLTRCRENANVVDIYEANIGT